MQVPKDIRDQLKKEIIDALNRGKTDNHLKKQTSDFVVKNYRSKNSMLVRGNSAKDLFEYDKKGLLVMRDNRTGII